MLSTTQPAPSKPITQKLFYIDNIRVILTILVVLHHACVTYGAPGGWYYTEKTTHLGALIPMTMFVSLNQSFFMGFFFLLAGYFTYGSYKRKGTVQFIKDRLVRLGLPLIWYSFLFSPVLTYLVYYFAKGQHITFTQYLGGFDDWIDFGVLWFVAALLLFTLTYVLIRQVNATQITKPLPAPGAGKIMLFALILGMLSFMVRIQFPVGWVLKPLGFQLGHFVQYIALFSIGILASKHKWFRQISYKTGKRMLIVAILLLLFFPAFYVIKIKINMPIEWYSGGFHWQTLLYAVWEQCIGIAIITVMLGIGAQRWNGTSTLFDFLSRRAFAVYIFHPLALVALSLTFKNWQVDPATKLLLVAPLGVISSFLLASIILLVPGVKRII